MEKQGPPPDGNQSQVPALIGMTIAMLSLSCIFVGLRFLTRTLIIKRLGWDDWTILFALLGTIIGAGLDFPEFSLGYGTHTYYISEQSYIQFQKYSYGEWIQTFATLMWTKVSICLFLLRIPVAKSLVRPLQAMIFVLIVSNIVLTLLWILQCSPVYAAWDVTIQKSADCFSKWRLQQIILAQAIISACSDFILAAFPILILYKVQIGLRTKVGLCLLMGLGVITGACCIVRTVLNWTTESDDSTWESVPNWMWRCLEVNFGIAAACIPALYPGYKHLQEKFFSRKGKSTGLPDSKEKLVRSIGGGQYPMPPRKAYHPIGTDRHKGSQRTEQGITRTTDITMEHDPPQGWSGHTTFGGDMDESLGRMGSEGFV